MRNHTMAPSGASTIASAIWWGVVVAPLSASTVHPATLPSLGESRYSLIWLRVRAPHRSAVGMPAPLRNVLVQIISRRLHAERIPQGAFLARFRTLAASVSENMQDGCA